MVNGVPDHCEIMMDVRVKSLKALQECRKKMEEVCAVTYIDGTSTELIMTDAMIPFESTPQVLSAYKAVKEISDEIGGTVTGSIVVGGSSDAAYIAANGAKVVCQCGVSGAFTHNVKEYAVVESLYEAIRLFICAVYGYERF